MHISSNLGKETSITVSDGYFKEEWGAATLIIE